MTLDTLITSSTWLAQERLESFTTLRSVCSVSGCPERNPLTSRSDIDQKVAPPLSVRSVGSSARLFVAEGDPFCALQVRAEGVQTSRLKTTSCFFNELFNFFAAQR